MNEDYAYVNLNSTSPYRYINESARMRCKRRSDPGRGYENEGPVRVSMRHTPHQIGPCYSYHNRGFLRLLYAKNTAIKRIQHRIELNNTMLNTAQ